MTNSILKNVKRLLSFSLILTNLNYFSQEILKPSTYPTVLFQTTDAKSVSMAGLGVATSADEYSVFHNPAKFIFLKEDNAKFYQLINYSNAIAFSNVYYLGPEINHTNLSGGVRITKFMAISGGFSFATQGDHFTEIGDKNIGDFQILVAPSFRLMDTQKQKLSTSVGLRYYGDVSKLNYGQSFAVDLASFYQILLKKDRSQLENIQAYEMNFGLSLQNLFGKVKMKNRLIDLPFSPAEARFAWSQYLHLKGRNFFAFHYESKTPLIPFNSDAEKDAFSTLFATFSVPASEFFGRIEHVLGLEFGFRGMFTLRSGVLLQNADYGINSSANFGFSFRYKMADFGFAYGFPLHRLNYAGQSFALSLAWSFKGKN